jgi:hypothetical protein
VFFLPKADGGGKHKPALQILRKAGELALFTIIVNNILDLIFPKKMYRELAREGD